MGDTREKLHSRMHLTGVKGRKLSQCASTAHACLENGHLSPAACLDREGTKTGEWGVITAVVNFYVLHFLLCRAIYRRRAIVLSFWWLIVPSTRQQDVAQLHAKQACNTTLAEPRISNQILLHLPTPRPTR